MIKKILKWVLITIISIFIVIIVLDVVPYARKYDQKNVFIRDNQRPLIIPHGGAKALFPENTLHAFESTDQYDFFEIDLTLTKDNILISHHDLDLRHDLNLEIYDPSLLIRNLTFNEVKQAIIGANYPYVRSFVDIELNKPYETTTDVTLLSKLLPVSLEAMFQAYEEKFYILEIKDLRDDSGQFNKAVIELLRLIKLYEMTDNVMVSSFDDDVLKAFKKLSKNEVYTSTATNETLKFVLLSALKIDFFYKPTDGAIVVPIKSSISDSQANLINKLPGFVKEKIAIKDEDSGKYYTNLAHQSLIDDARKHNMAVMFWTVNDKADMKKLILLGVDGIITDRPDLMVEVLVELDMYN